MEKYKQSKGKPRISLVPPALITEVAKVRTQAVDEKYPDPEGWRNVAVDKLIDAMGRHFVACLKDPFGMDEESRLPHLAHIATNAGFLLEKARAHQCDSTSEPDKQIP